MNAASAERLPCGGCSHIPCTSLVNDSLGSEGESEKSSVTFESDTNDKMSVESSDTLDNQSRLADIASSVTTGAMLNYFNYVLEPTSICNATFLGSEDSFSCSTLNKLTSADVIKSTTCDKPSVIFPCIMEALAWASQGRDNQIQVLDSAAIARPVPNHLSSAAQLCWGSAGCADLTRCRCLQLNH